MQSPEELKEKERLEYYATQVFVSEYNRVYGNVLEFVDLQRPPRPDALCMLNGVPLGVEGALLHEWLKSYEGKQAVE